MEDEAATQADKGSAAGSHSFIDSSLSLPMLGEGSGAVAADLRPHPAGQRVRDQVEPGQCARLGLGRAAISSAARKPATSRPLSAVCDARWFAPPGSNIVDESMKRWPAERRAALSRRLSHPGNCAMSSFR